MPSAAPVITTATEEEVRSGVLGRALREFNYRFVGEYPHAKPIQLNARDAAGALVGGLRSFVFLGWLRVEVLWVADAARGQGLGTRLLEEAERRALALGAVGAALETFEWQAPEFYFKRGYQVAGRIDRYVQDYALLTMQKRLDGGVPR